MSEHLQVAIAEDEPELLDDLELMLTKLGHEVVVRASDGRELVEKCVSHPVQLIVTDIKMPNMDGLEAVMQIASNRPVPTILVTAYDDDELVQKSLGDHVLGYLVKPINERTLSTTISLAMRRFREFEALHKECDNLRHALEDRKVIERAKGVITKRTGLDEEQAFRRLQQLASQKNEKLVVVARSILTAEEAYRLD